MKSIALRTWFPFGFCQLYPDLAEAELEGKKVSTAIGPTNGSGTRIKDTHDRHHCHAKLAIYFTLVVLPSSLRILPYYNICAMRLDVEHVDSQWKRKCNICRWQQATMWSTFFILSKTWRIYWISLFKALSKVLSPLHRFNYTLNILGSENIFGSRCSCFPRWLFSAIIRICAQFAPHPQP